METRGLDEGTRELTFRNGFRVVARHELTGPLLAIVLRIHTGSAADPPGKEGLAHLVEHLTFLSQLDGSGRLRDLQENRGALSNAFTTRDSTMRHATITALAARIAQLVASGFDPVPSLASEQAALVRTRPADLRAVLETCARSAVIVLSGDPLAIQRAQAHGDSAPAASPK